MNTDSIISPTLHTAAIGGLELAINKALALDPATAGKLARLDGHVFQLECTSPSLSLYLIPGKNDVRLCGIYEGDADTALKGSASAFTTLATSPDPANTLINGELELHGNSQALIELQQIGKQLDLDWEAPLTQLFGDVVGHQLGRGLRRGFRFANQALKNLRRQFDDYLVEESDLMPPRWEAEQFFNDVDQLNLRTERIEARIQKLAKSLRS